MTAELQVERLCAWYGQTQVLFDVDLVVEKGAVTSLLGANGAGKTTTLRAICGMVRKTGKVTFSGADISRTPTYRIARGGVGHVPDGRGTINELSVEENLRLAAGVLGSGARLKDGIERMYDHFPRLKERRLQQAGTLSGGEQQMLALSRALIIEPKLLLLDEPSFGLAPKVVDQIFEMILNIQKSQQLSILLVEQNARRALEISSHVYLMDAGRCVISGPAKELSNNDTVRRTYLGY